MFRKLANFAKGYRVVNSFIAENCIIEKDCIIIDSEIYQGAKILRGSIIEGSEIGMYTYVNHYSKITFAEIRNYCSISSFCWIGAHAKGHTYTNITTFPVYWHMGEEPPTNYLPDTFIGNDVWIGTNAIIKEHIEIGDGAVIGAGAVVTEDVPDFAIVAGVPARVIKYRFPKRIQKMIKDIEWWEYPLEYYKKYGALELLKSPPTTENLRKLKKVIGKILREGEDV